MSNGSGGTKPWGSIGLNNNVQRGLETLFAGYISQTPPLEGGNLLESIREDMGAMQFVNPDIVSNYEIYKRIRTFLEDRGVHVPRTSETGTLIGKRVIAAIWCGDDLAGLRKRAMDYFDAIRNGDVVLYSPSNASPTAQVPFRLQDPTPGGSFGEAAASNVGDETGDQYENKRCTFFTSRYRNRRDKFNGNLEEDWGEHITSFMDYCNDPKIKGSDREQYLHYSLGGDALNFYRGEIRDKQMSWGSVVAAFNDRYSSATSREDKSSKLESLHLSDFIKQDVSSREALDSLIKEIDRLTPMAHVEDRTDRRKRKLLATSVQGIPWARNILSQTNAKLFTYRGLMSELFSAELNNRQYSEGLKRMEGLDNSSSQEDVHSIPKLGANVNYSQDTVDANAAQSVLFTGQGRFGRPPKNSSSFKLAQFGSSRGSSHASTRSDIPLSLTVCWNLNARDAGSSHVRNLVMGEASIGTGSMRVLG